MQKENQKIAHDLALISAGLGVKIQEMDIRTAQAPGQEGGLVITTEEEEPPTENG